MLVTFPFGDPAVISCQLKDVLHQRTPTHLIHWNLKTKKKKRKKEAVIVVIKLVVKMVEEMVQGTIAALPWDPWNVLDTRPEVFYSMFCFGDCTHHRKVWWLWKGREVFRL